jgi:hypothetical protein
MKKSRFIVIIMMILPWFTLPLLGKRTIRRFLSAVLFISLFSEILQSFALKRQWWTFHSSIHPKIRGSVPFTLGPELFAAFWFLKMTYGKFLLFLLINSIAQYLFAFPGMKLLKKLRIVSLEKMPPLLFVVLLFFRGVLLYSFQYVKEKVFTKRTSW